MPAIMIPQKKEIKKPAPLSEAGVKDSQPPQFNTVDSAVSMTFPENVECDLASFVSLKNKPKMDTPKVDNPISNVTIHASTDNSEIVLVHGMPFEMSRIMEMGAALAKARRERMFPTTITPGYNVQATIDDYEDLERLNIAREGAADTRDDAFRPDVAGLYIKIQRRIQDRDLTHGEVAADSNVRARLSGFANSTGAETGMYNLMRHAMNSVLRLNNLTVDSESNVINVTNRVLSEIRASVQSQASHGVHGVDGVNMDNVMEHVFSAIEDALDGQIKYMSNITNTQNAITDTQSTQVKAISSHVNAIDNHVHAMGNNVNAMGALLNSTNGNVTSLTANIGVLQTIVNMLPQMVANSVQEILPSVFEAAISNELLNRMQILVNAAGEASAREDANGRPPSYRSHKESRSLFGKLNIFKKRAGRRGRRSDAAS
ncbi:hypothetical protein F5Y03DRAFT_410982 [Xylaria venustula]|nr:hypothetical protein F5Y03DRAFT_410982 [Xylaria venustula]